MELFIKHMILRENSMKVLTVGVYDLLHIGHVNLFKRARALGDYLIVAVQASDVVKKYKPKGVLHCFSGSVEMAKEIVKLGMYIGLGGAVTFKNAVKPCEIAKYVPSDRLLIETDAPYMTPVPFRGKRCDSLHIPYTAERFAELRGVTAQEILDLTDRNARTLFNIG